MKISFNTVYVPVSVGSGDQDAESGARLTCHLLLRLFSATDLGSHPALTIHPLATAGAIVI